MSDIAVSEPAIGHNQPPPDPIDTLLATSAEYFGAVDAKVIPRVKEIVRAANLWAKSVTEITSDEYGMKVEDFLKQIRDEVAALEVKRKALNEPHQTAIDTTNAAFRPIGNLFALCKDALNKIKTKCLAYEQHKKDEALRLARAEAARKEKEALEALEAVNAGGGETPIEAAAIADRAIAQADEAARKVEQIAATKPVVSGALSGRASGFRTVWSAEIEDWPKAAAYYSSNAKVREAIQSAANADARVQKNALAVPGVKAKSEQKV